MIPSHDCHPNSSYCRIIYYDNNYYIATIFASIINEKSWGGIVIDILKIILEHREARGWSEYQLAERSGLPQSTISSWYKKNMMPSLASMEKICEAFGITLSQLFAESDESISLTPSQRKMLDRWNCLTAEQQTSLLSLLDAMILK